MSDNSNSGVTWDSEGRTYHYALQKNNRLKVREQGWRINQSLKKLKKVSSPDWPKVVEEREPTEQFVTLPDPEAEDPILREALEEAEEAYKRSTKPPPLNGKSKRRWFGWKD